MIEVWGVMPGEFMGSIFAMLTPVRSATKYNLDLLNVVDDDRKFLNFLRMEKWLSDRPHHPGEAAKEWLKDLYQDNNLINNAWQLGGRDVDLTSGKLGTNDYTELGLPGGHIGLFVSAKSQDVVGKGIVDWLSERDA
jgi:polyhydroxyalkanoate synthase